MLLGIMALLGRPLLVIFQDSAEKRGVRKSMDSVCYFYYWRIANLSTVARLSFVAKYSDALISKAYYIYEILHQNVTLPQMHWSCPIEFPPFDFESDIILIRRFRLRIILYPREMVVK
jgi:hypothetical protein